MKLLWILNLLLIYASSSLAAERAFDCLTAELQLQCPGVKYITSISAFYGQWSEVCDGGCCQPGPDDCEEDMSQVDEHAEDYQLIITDCNNKTSCTVTLYPTNVYACESPYFADYAYIDYICYPEDPTTPPPTTTATTTPRPTYPTHVPPTTKKDDGGGGGGGGSQVAAIIGGVVAAILLIVLIVLLVYLYIRMKRKPPPKKRPIRIVKRPSAAQRPPGQPARANSYAQSKPAKNTNQAPVKSEPVPPYVAYDNKAYEQEVELVTEKKPQVNGGLAGMADIKGNVPNVHANGNTHYENIDNAHREMARPRSASKNNGQVPNQSQKPPFSRASKPVTHSVHNNLSTSRDSNYDTPRQAKTKPGTDPSFGLRPRSETKSSTASSKSDHTYIALEAQGDSVKFKNKPATNDVYEDIEAKKS